MSDTAATASPATAPTHPVDVVPPAPKLAALGLQHVLAFYAGAVIVPLLIVGLVPLITGDVLMANLFPLGPLAQDAQGNPIAGDWTLAGWTRLSSTGA